MAKGLNTTWLMLGGLALGVLVELAPIPVPLRVALRLAAARLAALPPGQAPVDPPEDSRPSGL